MCNSKNKMFISIFLLFILFVISLGVVSAADGGSTFSDEAVLDCTNEDMSCFDETFSADDLSNDEQSLNLDEEKINENLLKDYDSQKNNLNEEESNMVYDYDWYLEDIQNSNSEKYNEFINYLINNNSFEFRNDSFAGDGYFLYASKDYSFKLWDGLNYTIFQNDSYFASTAEKTGYFVNDGYYDDIIYYHEYNYYLDEEYLGWLMWNTNYKKVLISGAIDNEINVSQEIIQEMNRSTSSGNLPSSYDLRDYGFVTPVKDQGNTGNCWAFATMAALESHLLKTENTSYNLSQKWDFSENNLKNVMSSLGRNGTDKLVDGGGNMLMALAYLLRWSGPINESDDPYGSNYTGISEDVYPIKHVQGVKFLPPRQNYLDNDFIKEAILENGAAFVSMHWNQSYVNGNSYYYFNEGSQNNTYDHAVTIVGWDDNYSKYNFKNQTPGMGNGAFIIKNSWGTNSGDNGYYYVSYYDQIFCLKNNQYAGFVFTNVENVTNYDYNYNYNPLGLTGFLSVSSTTMNFANQWTALKNVTLKSFGLYVNYSSVCIANLIVNGLSICNTTTYLPYPGFHTVQFNQSANVNEGQTFRVEISLSNYETSGISLVPLESRVVNYSNVVSDFNQSFLWLYRNGVYQWVDLKNEVDNANICLHVYTECIEGLLETHVRSNNLITGFNSSSLNATLVDSSGNPLSNKNIIYEVNNVQYTRTTDSNGKASLAIRLNPGSYKFLISFLGDDTYHKSNRLVDVNVSKMHTNINQNVSTVHKGEYLGLTLKDSNGKALSGKRVAFCIINATYNRTTDTNGKAKLLIRLSPGTYSVTLRFNGTTGYYACNKTFNLKVLAAKSNPNPINDENYDESNIDNNIIMDNDALLESSYELIDNNTYKYIKSNNITDKDDIIKNNSNKNLLKISLENNDKMVYDNLNSDYPDNEKTESYSVNYTNNENHYIKDSLTEIRSSFINNPNLDSDDFIQIKIGGEYG